MIERLPSIPAVTAVEAALLARVPPHSVEAEQALLASIFLDPEMLGAVAPIVRPDDFYRTAHRRLYEVCLSLYERSEPADPLLVLRECERLGIVDDVGGREGLASLAGTVATAANAEHYARIVRDKAIARGLVHAATEIQRSAYEDEGGGDDLLERAEHEIFTLARTKDLEQAAPVSRLLHDMFRELDARDGSSSGVPTGFYQLDDLTSGLHKGELVIIAGRPSMGKTTFALNVAYNVAVHGRVPTAVFSLEMSRQQITKNVLCAHAQVEAHKLRGGRFLTDAEYQRLTEAAGPLYEAPLFIDDTPGLSTTALRAKCRRLKQKHELGFVVIDYLQLMEAIGVSRNVDSRQQEISYISRALKGLARELDVPVIALSQLNRAADAREDHRPRLSDLRECVTGDTPVVLADGRSVPIRDLVGTTPDVVSVDANGRLVTTSSDLVWRVGRRPVFRVLLDSGRLLRATAKHRFLGAGGWVRVESLRVGDRLALARRIPEPAVAEGWADVNRAYLDEVIGAGRYLRVQPVLWSESLPPAESDLSWDRVTAVEPAGVEEVFDLTVPATSAWLADGIVSHNSGSIEQDADVICFLFRKHYYTKAESDRGTAEVIVAKQRNGPTDTVQVAFLDQFMRFDNLALPSQREG